MYAQQLIIENGANGDCLYNKKWVEESPSPGTEVLKILRDRVAHAQLISIQKYASAQFQHSSDSSLLTTVSRHDTFVYILQSKCDVELIYHDLWSEFLLQCLNEQLKKILPQSLSAVCGTSEREALLRLNALIQLTISSNGRCYNFFENLGRSLLPQPRSGVNKVLDVITQDERLTNDFTAMVLSRLPYKASASVADWVTNAKQRPLGGSTWTGSSEGGLVNSGIGNWWRSDHIKNEAPSYMYIDAVEFWNAVVVNDTLEICQISGLISVDVHLLSDKPYINMFITGASSIVTAAHPCAKVEASGSGDVAVSIKQAPEGRTDVLKYLTLNPPGSSCQSPLNLVCNLIRHTSDGPWCGAITVTLSQNIFSNELNKETPLHLQNVTIRAFLPDEALSDVYEPTIGVLTVLRHRELQWTIGSLLPGSRPLSLKFDLRYRCRPRCEVLFNIPKWSLSGVTIESVDAGATSRGLRHQLRARMSYTL